MTRRATGTRVAVWAGIVMVAMAVACVLAGAQSPTGPASVDAAFARFWAARNARDAAAAADAVVKSGVTFDAALARLKAGRTYDAKVPVGVVSARHHLGPYDFQYQLDVPPAYDPSRKYQVRVQLHGGVGRDNPSLRGNGIGALAGAEQIYIFPTAWSDAPWWNDLQIENLREILDTVKRTYNVDENRVAMAGVSDGGTSTYYFAMRDTTPYASFVPLNGDVMVLSNRGNGIQGDLHPNNLRNKPFFAVNGGVDPLYPAWLVEPYLAHFTRRGVDVTFTVKPDAAHNTQWWPEEKDHVEAFVRAHPRDPHPEKLTWETAAESLDRRAHWLVVDALADANGAPAVPLTDINDFAPPPLSNFGMVVAGHRVATVTPGSAAFEFGFRRLDYVDTVNGKPLPEGKDVLDVLASFPSKAPIEVDLSRDSRPTHLTGAIDRDGEPTTIPLFTYQHPHGRVDLVRTGNTVQATTRGVAAFTLLLSPEVFDFSKPVKIVADGKTVFDGTVKTSVETLLAWAARDNDRTMLYGAEVHVKVTR